MAKAVHTMLRVLDLDRSREFYSKAFDLEVADHFDFDEFSLTYLRNDEADFEIELTHNKNRSEPYTHGDGFGHIAVCMDSIDAEHQRFKNLGLEPQEIKEFYSNGVLMGRFFFVLDPDGYKLEILERYGRFK